MNTAGSFAPLDAATGQAIRLAMQRLWLTGQILPAGARVVVQHVFQSEEEKALEVIYAFPLPRDGGLRSFRIAGEGFEAHSELKETEAAVEVYERGIANGSLSALVRQYGDGLVNLTVGNIRPGETVTVYLEILCGVELNDGGFRFRFPFTLAPAYHSRARTAMTEPGEGEMELPVDEFADMILPRFREDASALQQVGFDLTTVTQLTLDEIGSPTHTILVKREDDRHANVALAIEHDVPNRDLVLDVAFKTIEPQVLAGIGKDGTGHFAAVVPSSCFGANTEAPRRVVILLDRSGSMKGAPLQQACKAIDACLGALSETDSFGLVAFDNEAQSFQPKLVSATREHRDQAHQFLMKVSARGGTELGLGFLEASRILDGSGDVFVVTDGQVFGTEKILELARRTRARLHCLGIGSASQDRFLALLARGTGGVSRFVTPSERVDLPAVDLFASIGRPVASGLTAVGKIQPAPPSHVFGGTPVLLFCSVDDIAGAEIELNWTGGRLSFPMVLNKIDIADTVWLLQGSRLITDWESKYPNTSALAPLEVRRENRVAARLLELSRAYRLASREMSLVTVISRPGDHAGELPETRVVPVGMAGKTRFSAYFGGLRIGLARPSVHADVLSASFVGSDIGEFSLAPIDRDAAGAQEVGFTGFLRANRPPSPPPDQQNPAADDILLDLAARIESDGGMPGVDEESRAIASVVALLAFLAEGHTVTEGAFRSHVAKLVKFLESLKGLTSKHQATIDAVVKLANKGDVPAGDWVNIACTAGDHWRKVETAL